jgi:1-acyl-sn-glycerol-3-phosphate acyltransferase
VGWGPRKTTFLGAGRRVPPRKGRASGSVEGFFTTLLACAAVVQQTPLNGKSRPIKAERRTERPDLAALGESTLKPIEKTQIRLIRRSFEPGKVDKTLRWFQRNIGARWIDFSTKNLRHLYGFDRLPPLDPTRSYICVSNHRSFFDLYVITAMLVRRGMPHRMLFPVRSNFFYDTPAGFLVNGAMSFFAMYPPVFRERSRATLNLAGLDEVVWMARRGGAFIGLHPEGTRNKDGDPYTLLPAQSGVGRIIRHAQVDVIPVFINGLLTHDLWKQVSSNVTKDGQRIVGVFGKPVEFGGLLEENPSPRLYKRIADRTLEVIGELGKEEREIRARLEETHVARS